MRRKWDQTHSIVVKPATRGSSTMGAGVVLKEMPLLIGPQAQSVWLHVACHIVGIQPGIHVDIKKFHWPYATSREAAPHTDFGRKTPLTLDHVLLNKGAIFWTLHPNVSMLAKIDVGLVAE